MEISLKWIIPIVLAISVSIAMLMAGIQQPAQLPDSAGGEITTSDEQFLSLASVSKHNTASDCLTVISGKVYNVTSYIKIHPGGSVITQACGKEATDLFNTKGGTGKTHSAIAKQILQQFYVGEVGMAPSNASQGFVVSPGADTLPEGLASFLQMFPDAKINGYTMIIENNGKTYTVIYQDGSFIIKEGIATDVPGANVPPSLLTPKQNKTVVTTTTKPPVALTLTKEEIAKHHSISNCWIIINDNVYDVTSFIPLHPGGVAMIENACGTDATTAFNTKGGTGGSHSSLAVGMLKNYLLGKVGTITTTTVASTTTTTMISTTTIPTSTTLPLTSTTTIPTTTTQPASQGITAAQVALHNSQSDCWLIINNKVYGVTSYISIHPGGPSRIISYCGKDATTAFNTRGGTGTHSNTAKNILAGFYLNDLVSATTTTTTIPGQTTTTQPGATTTTTQAGSTTTTTIPTIQQVIQQYYPGASIQEINTEDNGNSEVQIKYNGQDVTVHLNAYNQII